MSDKSLEEDAVPSIQSHPSISITPQLVQSLLVKLKKQDAQLKGMSNIHMLVQAKDEELAAAKEKINNLSTALDKSEIRQANLIRLAGNGGKSTSVSISENVFSLPPPSPAKSSEISLGKNFSFNASDLEEDGCPLDPVTLPTQLPETFSSQKMHPVIPFDSKIGDINPIVDSLPERSDEKENSTFEKNPFPRVFGESGGTSMKSMPPSSSFFGVCGPPTDYKMKQPSYSSLQQPGPSGAPGVSNDLVDKLVQQNLRLKKAMREILNQRGLSLNAYLDKQEYEDIIAQSREDMRLARHQITQLRLIITSKNEGKVDELAARCGAYVETVSKLERAVTTNQAMAEACTQEYDKIKAENAELRAQRFGSNPSTESRVDSVAGHQQQVSSLLSEIHSLKTSQIQLAEQLKAEKKGHDLMKQTHQELLGKYEKLEAEIQRLNREVISMADQLETEKLHFEKEMVETKDHYKAELRATLEKMQQLQTSLAKHQEWIRKLVLEAQRCRDLYEDEMKRQAAKNEEEMKRQAAKTSPIVPLPCSLQLHQSQIGKREYQFPRQVTIDGLAEDRQVSPQPFKESSQMLQAYDGNTSPKITDEPKVSKIPAETKVLICPRCEREYSPSDKLKYQEHVAKCTDE